MTRKLNPGRIAGLGAALALAAAGTSIMYASLHAQDVTNPSSTKSTDTRQAVSAKPSPKAIAAYTVAPDLPKYLLIPSIGVDARILSVGLTSSGAVSTPNNVFDTAWYTGSAKPGQPGAALIDGHISSWTSPGVFYNLTRLKAGDTVKVVRGDNAIFTYKVVKLVIYPSDKVDMGTVLSPVVPGTNGLNLISCTGDVIPHTSEFNERVVVFTQQA